MDLARGFSQTLFSTVAPELVAASTVSGRVQCLNALHITVVTTGVVRIASVTTDTTGPLVEFAMKDIPSIDWPFDPRPEGVIRGLANGNLQISTTGPTINGYSITSYTTMPAT